MPNFKNKDFVELIKNEMAPALGVTEPSAIALVTAKAYQAIGGDIKSINVTMDEGVFKNGFSCAIPGTDQQGNEMSALLGALAGDPDLGMRVLEKITPEDVEKAKQLEQEKIAKISFKKGMTDIYLDAKVETDRGIGRAIIEDTHSNIVLVEVNGKVVFEKQKEDTDEELDKFDIKNVQVEDIMSFVDNVPTDDIAFILEAIKLNNELAEVGKEGPAMGLGKAIYEMVQEKIIGDDIISFAQMYTAYAIDARMGGIPKPAMSICGSGDHGLIGTMPLIAIAEKQNIDQERLLRSIALSYLITIYIKVFSGRLSAFCGCAVAAGTGVSAGVVYLLGGDTAQVGYSIKNMACNLTGIICDGGNYGCTLKAITSAAAAVQAALFALKDIRIPDDSGIVGYTVEETMQNIGKIASPGMLKTNDVILDIMVQRRKE